jgi:outer membrane immunogenic protein
MRKQLICGVAAAAIIAVVNGPAAAADIVRKAPPAPPAPLPPPCMWCGFYLGGHVGGAWSRTDTQGFAVPGNSDPSANQTHSFKIGSVALGLHAGYNWQFAPWVFGIEGDFTALPGHDKTVDNLLDGGETTSPPKLNVVRLDWLASIRGRLGYAFDRSLIYATGGVGFVGGRNDIFSSSSLQVLGKDRFTHVGWVAGGGWEWKYNPNLSFRIEGLFYGFQETESGCAHEFHSPETLCVDAKLRDVAEVRVGATYHFGDFGFGKGKAPVVARY